MSNCISTDIAFQRCLQKFCANKFSMISTENASKLLLEGLAVPFISRYRKEEIGELMPQDLFELNHVLEGFSSTVKMRDAKIRKLTEDGKITNQLLASFNICTTLSEVEELWLPFKEKHSTNSSKAKSVEGMEEFSESLLQYSMGNVPGLVLKKIFDIPVELRKTMDAEKAAHHIITEKIAHDVEYRSLAREIANGNILVTCGYTKAALEGSITNQTGKTSSTVSNYRDYESFSKPLCNIPSYQLLAMRRGSDNDILNVKVTLNDRSIDYYINKLKKKIIRKGGNPGGSATFDSICVELVKNGARQSSSKIDEVVVRLVSGCIEEAVRKSIVPSIVKDLYKQALKDADLTATKVFGENLKRLLLTPPLSALSQVNVKPSLTVNASDFKVLCSIDPGFSHGHKVAVISVNNNNQSGTDNKILATRKIFVKQGDAASLIKARTDIRDLCDSFSVDCIVIGDGQGSKQAVEIVCGLSDLSPSHDKTCDISHKKRKISDNEALSITRAPLVYAVVSECGASVYSASDVARQEFPTLDISYLGCVSIAMRFVNPLSELVKIPPESLGIGMYQHDVDAKMLTEQLSEVVEMCVNDVGVDVNTASVHLLKYVSGINDSRAKAIVEYRKTCKDGRMTELTELKKVKGIGAVSFKNAAGFLRIYSGTEPLDATCVHPEQYSTAKTLLKLLSSKNKVFSASEVGGSALIEKLITADRDDLASKLSVTRMVVDDLCYWLSLRKLGKNSTSGSAVSTASVDDIRLIEGHPPQLKACEPVELSKNNDQILETGAIFTGKVKNIAPFGAFVDIGVGRDGLLHVSALKNSTRLKNINDLTVGELVQVKVSLLDNERNRISLALCE